MTEEELKYETENIGLAFDKLGMTPIAGRIMAFLMLSDPPFRSFDDIVDHLQASKSSVSTTLKYLGQVEMISYKTFPGDRRRYFGVAPDRWISQINIHEKFRLMVKILNHVLEIRAEDDHELSTGLKDVRDMYLYFETEIPRMLQRWEEIRKNRQD